MDTRTLLMRDGAMSGHLSAVRRNATTVDLSPLDLCRLSDGRLIAGDETAIGLMPVPRSNRCAPIGVPQSDAPPLRRQISFHLWSESTQAQGRSDRAHRPFAALPHRFAERFDTL